ncbi:MAG: hypothetical protein CM1200mP41_00110 [Gammaproteobacteria bacterium]|nr:MAG: hypothetical protein CM1200mP41_00110 [Gammaproteobacteria bacterium]
MNVLPMSFITHNFIITGYTRWASSVLEVTALMASTMGLSIAICWRVFCINATGRQTPWVDRFVDFVRIAVNQTQTLVNDEFNHYPKSRCPGSTAAAESGGAPVLRVAAKRDRDGAIDYAMGFDEPREEDTVSLQHGVRLLIAPTSMELLNDTVLDFFLSRTRGSAVYFRNPNDPNYQTAT